MITIILKGGTFKEYSILDLFPNEITRELVELIDHTHPDQVEFITFEGKAKEWLGFYFRNLPTTEWERVSYSGEMAGFIFSNLI